MGNIIPVKLSVCVNGKYEPRTIYAEEGMSISFGGKSYKFTKDAKAIVMDAKYYAALGGVSQEVRENDPHNKDSYVLTNSDVANIYNNRHDGFGILQNHVNSAQDRLDTGSKLKTSPETGNATDVNPQQNGLTIHLRDSHNKSTGSISIFKAK